MYAFLLPVIREKGRATRWLRFQSRRRSTYSVAAFVGGGTGGEHGKVKEFRNEEAHDAEHGNTAVLDLSFLSEKVRDRAKNILRKPNPNGDEPPGEEPPVEESP